MRRRRSAFFKDILCLGVIVVPTLLTLLSYAAGLRVGPSDITLKNIPVGVLCDFKDINGVTLKIYNDCEDNQIYEISTLKSSEINNVPEGYTDIPDEKWLYFEKNQVEIEPDGVKEVKMYLKIPYDKKYYNKKWVVSVRVKSIPKMGESISLACHPRIRLETVRSEDAD